MNKKGGFYFLFILCNLELHSKEVGAAGGRRPALLLRITHKQTISHYTNPQHQASSQREV